MMHDKRRWGLAEIESAETLATMLTQKTWTLCSAFVVKGHDSYLFLNDATHEDGALEIGVVKHFPDGTFVQIDSITFSWCTAKLALEHVRCALAGEYDRSDFARPVHPQIDQPNMHKNCSLCA